MLSQVILSIFLFYLICFPVFLGKTLASLLPRREIETWRWSIKAIKPPFPPFVHLLHQCDTEAWCKAGVTKQV